MTYDKALDKMTNLTITYSQIDTNTCELFTIAKEAIEKQIPKKVDMTEFDIDELNTDDRHLIHICCPICGRALRLFNAKEFCCFNGNIVEPFCSKCGQALDWSK